MSPSNDDIPPPEPESAILSTPTQAASTRRIDKGVDEVTLDEAAAPVTLSFVYQSRVDVDPFPPETELLSPEIENGDARTHSRFDDQVEPIPDRIGRYRVTRRVGSGGFGIVYQGLDEDLRRDVAIKVPHQSQINSEESVKAFLAEGRIVAGLDHPGIVPIYDVGLTHDGRCYLVSKFIAGCDLSAQLKNGPLVPTTAARILLQVAEALQHAHDRGLIHRDIKPANILIDPTGHPILTDFGLALRDDDELGRGPLFAGSPPYMSPEQIRLESHLVDARTDLYSLGVVFYELLTGHRPFRAPIKSALFRQIQVSEPRPLRQVDETIPRELDRICLKALSKRSSDRFGSATEFAEDLRYWLARDRHRSPSLDGSADSAISGEHSLALVVPRGLRSFDDDDSDFFLSLLPGPRDRDGLPSRLRFWKTRLETNDPDRGFRVGLIYGPSGSGKSSFVKAGLLPNLAEGIIPIYLEASPLDTEARLLQRLRAHCPSLRADLGLVASMTRIRQGRGLIPGQKLLIVLDQFEQWLHGRTPELTLELVQALRQCDGSRVQGLLLVRDDFWMSTTRFMREIEVPVAEGHNSSSLDVFDTRHARKVLAGFGRAFGTLLEEPLSTEHERFLDRAVAELAEDGKVIPVRLALFGEMFKTKPWTVAALKEVGGASGLGVSFLEEMLGENAGQPSHRVHQKAARAVLKALLPEPGREIKGQARSYQDLLDASGYAANPSEFEELLRILDAELRLITPTDPLTSSNNTTPEPTSAPRLKSYQLSHDYLIEPLRHWLSAKQSATWSGRAEICLAERASLWTAIPENRQLPSWWEWARISAFGRGTPWTASQTQMMAAATRLHLRRGLVAAGLIGIALTASLWFRDFLHRRQQTTDAQALVSKLLAADIDHVPGILHELNDYRSWAHPRLVSIVDDPDESAQRKLHANLALVSTDPGRAPYLIARLLEATPDELLVIRGQLEPRKDLLKVDLWRQLEAEPSLGPEKKLRAACALAVFDPASDRWRATAPSIVRQLVEENSLHLKQWINALRPVSRHLIEPLAAIYRGNDPAPREVATVILADYASRDSAFVADLIRDADVRQYHALFRLLEPHRSTTRAAMLSELNQPAPLGTSEEEKDRQARRQANAAVTLYRFEDFASVWPIFKQSRDPRLRSQLIHALPLLGADPNPIAARWSNEPDAGARRALLLALGELGPNRLPPAVRKSILDDALKAYRDDPDAGIHGASAWLLIQWGGLERVREIDRDLLGRKPEPGRGWSVTTEGHTMTTLAASPNPGDGETRPARASVRNP